MAVVPVIPVGGVVRKQKQIVALFQAAGATNADRATTAATLGIHEGVAFRILRRHAVLRDGEAGRVYLDESRWESHQKKRRRLALIIPGLVLLVAIVLWAIFR